MHPGPCSGVRGLRPLLVARSLTVVAASVKKNNLAIAAIAWSRLELHCHDGIQVVGGLGFGIFAAFLWIFIRIKMN